MCRKCRTHITAEAYLVSRDFQSASGRAYLYDRVINVKVGDEQRKQMTTGQHIVRDVLCLDCNNVLGWRYEKAMEESQRYKEGKYCVERAVVQDVHIEPPGRSPPPNPEYPWSLF